MLSEAASRKLILLDRKAALRHRSNCTYDPSIWSNPDGDFCSCDLHQRKAVIDEELATL